MQENHFAHNGAALHVDAKSIQHELAQARFYGGRIDGIFGKISFSAGLNALRHSGIDAAIWPRDRQMIAIEQWYLTRLRMDPGVIDGYMGPSTAFAIERWQNWTRDRYLPQALQTHLSDRWPVPSGLSTFYGPPGTNHVLVDLPYPMFLAWDTKTQVTRTTVNKKCAESLVRALTAALDHYGIDEIGRLGLNLFGGVYNNRNVRGGYNLSVHAYAAAIDIDPLHNQMRWDATRARMATQPYRDFIGCFEAEGWVNMGRERNFDYMHFQAARL